MPNVAPQIGTKYTLVGPSGARVTFNDSTDADNVGMLTNISGTDSPEVREDGENLVQADGGAHGPFLYGRRPIMLEGLIYGHVSDAQRNERVARLLQACDAMSSDATLSWQPSGGAAVYLKLRRQQAPKINGGWNKTFQISLVAADPRFYGATLNTITKTTTAASTLVNAGNADTFPMYTVWGPLTAALDIQIGGLSAVRFNKALDLDRGFVIDGLNRSITGYRRRVNQYKNPSFEHATVTLVNATTNDAFGMFVTGNPTLDAHAAQPTPSSGWGTKVLKMTTTGTGAIPAPGTFGGEKVATAVMMSGQSNPGAQGGNTFQLPAYDLARKTYVVLSFSVLRASASPSTYVPYATMALLDDSSDPVISSSWVTQYRGATTISDTVWHRETVAFEIPNTPTGQNLFAEMQIGALNPTGNMAAGQIWYFDAVTIEITQGASNPNFFYPDGVTYAWEGTADNSRTYSIAADPLVAATANYELLDFPNTSWKGLAPGNNTLSLLGSFTTGGSLRVDWRDAWL
jgi:hypothetical protein